MQLAHFTSKSKIQKFSLKNTKQYVMVSKDIKQWFRNLHLFYQSFLTICLAGLTQIIVLLSSKNKAITWLMHTNKLTLKTMFLQVQHFVSIATLNF